jgi:hypothetical protein
LDKLLRFSDYDVFGYVASGLAALAFWDLAFGTSYVVGAQWTVASGALTIGGAYMLGQILASPSSWLIERRFVRKVLGSPSVILMDDVRLGWRRFLKAVILTLSRVGLRCRECDFRFRRPRRLTRRLDEAYP